MKISNLLFKSDSSFKVMGSPLFWAKKAEEQKYAAEILWPHVEARLEKLANKDIDALSVEPELFPIFLSLLGFSIEALLKGIIIKNNPQFITNGKLSRKVSHHELNKLSKLAKIDLSENEEILCKQAYDAMTYESRYPIPKNKENMSADMLIGEHPKHAFDNLYNRLHPQLGGFYRQ